MAEQILLHRPTLHDTDAARTPLAGGTVTFVRSGTNEAAPIFADEACTVALTNPLPADGTGALPQVWTNAAYQIDAIIKRPDGSTADTLLDVARVGSTSSAASGVSVMPTDNLPANSVQAALDYLADRVNTALTRVQPQELGGTSATNIGELREALQFGKAAESGSIGIAPFCEVSGSTANTLTLTTGISLTTLPAWQELRFVPGAANTGPMTFNVDGLGNFPAKTATGAEMPAGYVRANIPHLSTFTGSEHRVSRAIETGSNANGRFVRCEDGTLICTHSLTITNVSTATGAVFRSDDVTWTFPAQFVNTTGLSVAAPGVRTAAFVWGRTRLMNATGATAMLFATESQTGSIVIDLQAIGRWY